MNEIPRKSTSLALSRNGLASSFKQEEPVQEVIKQEVKYYTVEMGDTLAGISYKLYNSANYIKKIMKLNNIEDENVIIAGQKLIVP